MKNDNATRQTDWVDGFCSGICLAIGMIAILGFILYIVPAIFD